MLDVNHKKDNIASLGDEKARKSVAVWLIIKDGLHSRNIALQKRLVVSGQSNAGICQPTWNEKLEEGESLIDAITRGAKEELGEDFYNIFNFSQLTQSRFDSFEFKGNKFISYNFVGSITQDQLKTVKIHSEALPDFIYVGKGDISKIRNKNEASVDAQKDIVLFDDQYHFLVKFLSSKQYYAFL